MVILTRDCIVSGPISKRDRRAIDLVKIIRRDAYVRVHEQLVPRVIQLGAWNAFERILRSECSVYHLLLGDEGFVEWCLSQVTQVSRTDTSMSADTLSWIIILTRDQVHLARPGMKILV